MGGSVSMLCQMARADHLVMTQSHCPHALVELGSLLLSATRMNTLVPGCKLSPMLLLSIKELSGVHFISMICTENMQSQLSTWKSCFEVMHCGSAGNYSVR